METEARVVFRDGPYEVYEVWVGGRSSYRLITPFGSIVCETLEEAMKQMPSFGVNKVKGGTYAKS